MAKVTLQTIADQLGVSRMTVSNAFSRPDQLSATLRERILATAAELGYVGPNPAARALARGTTGAIGVLLTDSLPVAFTDEMAIAFLGAIARELAPTGLAMTLLATEETGDVVPARDVAIDGALAYACHPGSSAQDWLRRRRIPLVLIDQQPVAGVASVNVDDRGGAATAARHLVGLGHRHVAIVSPADERVPGTIAEALRVATAHPTRQRLLGWSDALDAAGIDPTVVPAGEHDEGSAREAAHVALTLPDRPTAVLCFSDALALAVVRGAAELGLAVPGDVSVVGFDDVPAAGRAQPALTTVRQDVPAKARLAVSELTSAIERAAAPSTRRTRHHLIPTELIVRETTAAPTAPRAAARRSRRSSAPRR